MHITSEYPAPLSPRVNLRIQGGGNNRPEWVATFAPESVATIVPEWVATFARNPHHLVYFVSDVIDNLDLGAMESVYEKEDRGYPPYHPHMMTKVLVYAYCIGVYSSRKIQKHLVEDVAFRVR